MEGETALGWFSRLRKKAAVEATRPAPATPPPPTPVSKPAPVPITEAAPPAERVTETPDRDLTAEQRWVNVQGVGEYQRVLAGPVPRAVDVELFAWDRAEQITVRLDGERIGDLPWQIVGPAHAALRARRQMGLPPVFLPAEIRPGDFVPAYLAVQVPTQQHFDAWLATVTPEGWTKPRDKEEYPYFSTAKAYQESLADLFAKYGDKDRGMLAKIEFETRQDKKGNDYTVGVVKRDQLIVTEFQIDHPRWEPIYTDYQSGTPGRLLVRFSRSGEKYRASGVYKTPKPAAASES